jgi:phosphomannomutase
MFGTSGIRGVYGKDITEDLAERVSSIFSRGKLAVGRDIRESGPSLLGAVARGAISAGSDVIDLSVVPTPTAALATLKHSCRGIMLTASHNPPEYNGLKLMEGGKEIGKALEAEVTRMFRAGLGKAGRAGGPGGGSLACVYHDRRMIDDHKAMVSGLVDHEAIRRRGPKVIVDCNGAASVITPYLLTDLGCRVTSVNSSRHCMNRPSEPKEENLWYLGGLVRAWGADFAIAHDGDGDRCIVIDEEGSALPFDVQLAIMIGHELSLSPRKRIVTTVESSLIVREAVEEAGGRLDITPVGSTWVGDRLEEEGALFGGEPCGEYIYEKGVHVPDAVLAAAKFAEIFCAGGAFSGLKKRYRESFIARERFPVKDKAGAMAVVREAVDIAGETRTDDGIRVDEGDGWFLVRPSGTEPIIRLTMEYRTKARLEERKAKLLGIIHRAVR